MIIDEVIKILVIKLL